VVIHFFNVGSPELRSLLTILFYSTTNFARDNEFHTGFPTRCSYHNHMKPSLPTNSWNPVRSCCCSETNCNQRGRRRIADTRNKRCFRTPIQLNLTEPRMTSNKVSKACCCAGRRQHIFYRCCCLGRVGGKISIQYKWEVRSNSLKFVAC
jgi:hypothetical protein